MQKQFRSFITESIRVPEERVFPACIEQDLGVLARVPLASGFLSGKYKPGAVFSDNVRKGRGSRRSG